MLSTDQGEPSPPVRCCHLISVSVRNGRKMERRDSDCHSVCCSFVVPNPNRKRQTKKHRPASRRVPLPGSGILAARDPTRPPRTPAARPGVGPAHTAARAPPDVHVGRSFARKHGHICARSHHALSRGSHARFQATNTLSQTQNLTAHETLDAPPKDEGRRSKTHATRGSEDRRSNLAATPRITARLTGHRQPRGALGAAAPVQASPRLSRSRRGSPSPSRRACPAHGWKTAARRP